MIPSVTSDNPCNAEMTIVPYVASGKPGVAIVVKKRSLALQDALLDGEPALFIGLGDESGRLNAPSEMGSLLAQQWEVAVAMAKAEEAQSGA